MIKSINPYTGAYLDKFKMHSKKKADKILKTAQNTFQSWKEEEISSRVELLNNLSGLLQKDKRKYAELITEEMGKPITQSIAEIDKCIWMCDFYSVNADNFLSDALIDTEASESFISHDPIGVILGIMPWNYPFWQVLRFAVPTLTAGNTIILKHASNVTGCAAAIQQLFLEANYPEGCFQYVLVKKKHIKTIIKSNTIQGVSLTGSDKVGKKIASIAGKSLKKTVLELGGNNACIVWEDADLKKHVKTMVNARMQNAGQSCIAAKRFIILESIYDQFIEMFVDEVKKIKVGDTLNPDTELGVLATVDLAQIVERQVEDSVAKGAKIIIGGKRKRTFFEPTVLTEVAMGMPAFDEEVFGPVASIIKAKNKDEAFKMAANSRYGLGTMLFTKNIKEARKSVSKIEDGSFFINEMVKSDPRLPFGGTKNSGYGRELSKEGMLEFVNKKVVYIK